MLMPVAPLAKSMHMLVGIARLRGLVITAICRSTHPCSVQHACESTHTHTRPHLRVNRR